MFRKQISAMLICLLLVTFSARFAFGQDDKKLAAVKSQVAKYDANKKKGINVKTRYGMKYNGFISRMGAENFDITSLDSGKVSTLDYRDVVSVKRGIGFPKWLLVVGITIGTVFLLAFIINQYCTKTNNCRDY